MSSQTKNTQPLPSQGEAIDVKFYYQAGCTKEDIKQFNKKANEQIKSGNSQRDVDFDSVLLD